jgi:6-phosphogluconate dehydrogenase (decarboxylating)
MPRVLRYLNAKKEFDLDLKADQPSVEPGQRHPFLVTRVSRRALLIRIPKLAGIRGYVEDSGEGRWTVEGVDSTQRSGAGDCAFSLTESDSAPVKMSLSAQK